MTPPLNRRDFLQATVATTALAAASGTVRAAVDQRSGAPVAFST